MKKQKFSIDPNVKLVSIEKFFDDEKNLTTLKEEDFFTTKTIPEPFKTYFKFTEKYLISVFYGFSITNYGTSFVEKAEEICVAVRDGKSEYDAYENIHATVC